MAFVYRSDLTRPLNSGEVDANFAQVEVYHDTVVQKASEASSSATSASNDAAAASAAKTDAESASTAAQAAKSAAETARTGAELAESHAQSHATDAEYWASEASDIAAGNLIDDTVSSTAKLWSSQKTADTISNIGKADIGLGNVDNTADADKPVSGPQQAALDGKLDATAKAADSDKLDGLHGEQFLRSDAKSGDNAVLALGNHAALDQPRSIELSTTTTFGGVYDNHTGIRLISYGMTGWGTAKLGLQISTNIGVYGDVYEVRHSGTVGAETISTAAPSGGATGDKWFQV